MEARLDRALRLLLTPVVTWLTALRVPPIAVTIAGLLLAGAGATMLLTFDAAAVGYGLMVLATLCDALDGDLARRRAHTTSVGTFLDSVVDRLVEGVVYLSIIWDRERARDTRYAVVLIAVLFLLSYLCSYCALWLSPGDPKSAAAGPISRGGRISALFVAVGLLFVGQDALAYGVLGAAVAGSLWALGRRVRQAARRAAAADRLGQARTSGDCRTAEVS